MKTPIAAFLLAAAPAAAGEQEKPEALAFFESTVRPVLADRCFKCHATAKPKSGLRLDSLEGMIRGGKRGPAIRPGKAKESLLILAINHGEELQMPPKRKLPPRAIADLARWVDLGAPWPDARPAAAPSPRKDPEGPLFTEDELSFWAFQPPDEPAIPVVRRVAWPASPLDHFILASLEAKGLQPAAPADRRTLIRRATLDLLGLPPTPREVEAFLADDAPGPFERVIDRLLASPRYGERWGRHWLDVARYADSNGMDENMAYANAFRYRDYVVRAFNADLPYDRFIHEQLAGDLLQGEPAADRLTATGFLSVGPKMLADDDPRKKEMDIIDEQLSTVCQAFMALTMGCARCHDHKFDPIPTADYYSLAAIFKSTHTMDTLDVVAKWHEHNVAPPGERKRAEEHEKSIRDKDREIKDAKDKKGRDRLKKEKKALEGARPKLPRAMGVREGKVQDLRVHIRGNYLTLAEAVPRRFPRILAGNVQEPLGPESSGRLRLAQWLTRPNHALTARVMANRIWRWHFGRGIVRTVDNFGMLGSRPDHPELLDWMALRFVEGRWSIKKMHRLIMLSTTYRMSGAHQARAAEVDPENRLLWRFGRRRLEAEAVRDSVLAVAGRLDTRMYGQLLKDENRKYVSGTASNPETYASTRRSVYLPVLRSAVYKVLQAFDFPDPAVSNGDRPTTTVAPQALLLMNSRLTARSARSLADSLQDLDDAGRIRAAYARTLGRPPTEREINRAKQALKRLEQASSTSGAWQSLCRVLLSSNEFIYIE